MKNAQTVKKFIPRKTGIRSCERQQKLCSYEMKEEMKPGMDINNVLCNPAHQAENFNDKLVIIKRG